METDGGTDTTDCSYFPAMRSVTTVVLLQVSDSLGTRHIDKRLVVAS